MLNKLITGASNAWRDEMTMLWLAIAFGLPIALLVVMNFGVFFVFMARHTELMVAVAGIEVFCLLRAGFLRIKKLT